MNIKTKIHTYSFDIGEPEEKKAYTALRKRLKPDHRRFKVNAEPTGERIKWEDGQEVELETKFIFSDQWNTACGKRVFDWYEGVIWTYEGRESNRKSGHYLEMTPEMEEIRRNTLTCGFCGKHYQAAQGYLFCDRCLDSEYLKESQLFMLRLLPAGEHFPKREPLTDRESKHLLPQYVKRQTTGDDSRAVKKRQGQHKEIVEKYRKNKRLNETEHKGMLWLWHRGINLDNVIYYSHTDVFSFGWRSPVSPSVKSRLLDQLCEFEFAYEIKTEEGKVSTRV